MIAVYWIFRKANVAKIDKGFRFGKLFSAVAFSLEHSGNDAQKRMGIITAFSLPDDFCNPARTEKRIRFRRHLQQRFLMK